MTLSAVVCTAKRLPEDQPVPGIAILNSTGTAIFVVPNDDETPVAASSFASIEFQPHAGKCTAWS